MRIPALISGLAVILGACTDSAKGDPEPKPVPVANPLLDKLATARHLPSTPPISPAQHYWIQGKVTFHLADQEIVQTSDQFLAGPERMRFQLGDNNLTNTFSLFDAEHCWVKQGANEFIPYEAAELLTETTVRWNILRFPWGWEKELLAIGKEFLFSSNDLTLTVVRETNLGSLTISTNARGFPIKAQLGGSSAVFADWSSNDQSTTIIPHSWQWEFQQRRRSETVESLHEGALFHDEAFRPVEKGEGGIDLAELSPEQQTTVGDEFGVVAMDFMFLPLAAAEDWQGDLPAGSWWQAGEQRYFIAASANDLTSDLWRQSSSASTLWLRWATYADIETEAGVASLRAVMKQTGYHSTGVCWALEVADDGRAHRHVFMMPVVKD